VRDGCGQRVEDSPVERSNTLEAASVLEVECWNVTSPSQDTLPKGADQL